MLELEEHGAKSAARDQAAVLKEAAAVETPHQTGASSSDVLNFLKVASDNIECARKAWLAA